MLCQPAIASMSLGRACAHGMPAKLDEAARHGFDIELFHEDLLSIAELLPGGPTPHNQIKAAEELRSMCDDRDISIMCLQPFMHYEGLRDRLRHDARIVEMKLWIQLAQLLGTNLIAIPSSFLSVEEASGDLDLIIRDLQEIADLGRPAGMQFSYEALCWGTYVDHWEQSWDIVQRVDRPNFGLCLDTFNICGRVYADPASPSGKTHNADQKLAASIQRLVATVDVNKIAFVQVVDAERLHEPLVKGHKYFDTTQPARMSWSRNCRLFYGEEDRGAYLPVYEVLRAIIVDLGYRGYVSAELFSRTLSRADPNVPRDHASRAAKSWDKIVADFDLDTEMPQSFSSRVIEQPRALL
ncbi:3-dehydroshikimate dehydratase [Dissoconium aciculare CBS 342.82]|uniref:3-dehydroshikimate dehydratase n=1 Tax=Dissoconium aciculare CBS 342.82 TaxID=1314786 RepID=A0A6J3MD85_9PEZI|nr:3-dehydroshikimate dehydratase [Dissoconium aciculare CBS 342.82]KAF1825976.1 3-dehydroshikimate dehydratase [Dissoconium aciculare CBS 342.82]